mmetsp:Transcript_11304/g.69795  ORF Transcript_11304/g.69795 Transcript_11304/m.69795 type:complete len:318 (+) Transcript_11304:353-1306(+)
MQAVGGRWKVRLDARRRSGRGKWKIWAGGRDGPDGSEPTWRRREVWMYAATWTSAAVAWTRIGASGDAQADPVQNKALQKAFEEAFAAGDDLELAIHKWSKAIDIDPDNSLAWANRGTVRLQALQWSGAASDLETAKVIEESVRGQASALTLINLGNSKVPLGELEEANECFLMAADANKELESIALANYALVSFEGGNDGDAIRTARRLLARDANFWDARAALTAFLWAAGEESQAEEQWTILREKGDSTAAALYPSCQREELEWPDRGAPICGSLKRVAGRWPPRATAALGAFLGATRNSKARGYDGNIYQYSFT